MVLALVLAAFVVQTVQGEVLRPSHNRSLRLVWNIFTNRGWSTKAGLGVGFKYEAYGGKVKLGPFSFKKDEATDFEAPTLFEELTGIGLGSTPSAAPATDGLFGGLFAGLG